MRHAPVATAAIDSLAKFLATPVTSYSIGVDPHMHSIVFQALWKIEVSQLECAVDALTNLSSDFGIATTWILSRWHEWQPDGQSTIRMSFLMQIQTCPRICMTEPQIIGDR